MLKIIRIMLTAKIKNYSKDLVNEDRMTIDLIVPEDITINPNQVKFYTWPNVTYTLSQDVIGFPYSKSYKLYAPYKFIWKGDNNFNIAIHNTQDKQIIIPSNTYIATIRLMSIQYFNLMRRHDNSDKNLASAPILIQIENEKD